MMALGGILAGFQVCREFCWFKVFPTSFCSAARFSASCSAARSRNVGHGARCEAWSCTRPRPGDDRTHMGAAKQCVY